MSLLARVFVLIVFTMLSNASRAVAQMDLTKKASEGPYQVEVIDERWRDDARAADPSKVEPLDDAHTPEQVRVSIAKSVRGRAVPVRVYVPISTPTVTEKFPVVVFSHGMGGTREGYEYIARHLASHGYVVVLPQHAGSDKDAVLEAGKERIRGRGSKEASPSKRSEPARPADAPRRTTGARLIGGIIDENTSDPANLENRPKDVSFVIDRVASHERLSKIVDLQRVAVAGHSFGAYTTMAVCGMRVDVGEREGQPARSGVSLRDARVVCGVAMSPQGSGMMGIVPGAWDSVAVPMMLVTGTKDMGQGDRAASWRHEAFASLKRADAYFLNITGADHMTFSGRSGVLRTGEAKAEYLALVKQAVTAFFDAYLRDDAKAKRGLLGKQIRGAGEGACEFEARGGKP